MVKFKCVTENLHGFTKDNVYNICEDFIQHRGFVYNTINDERQYIEFDKEMLEKNFVKIDKDQEYVEQIKFNVGTSDYSKHNIQPWDIWVEYNLDPFDADIVKRVLRTKKENGLSQDEARILDYKKIIHVCQKKIELIQKGYKYNKND